MSERTCPECGTTWTEASPGAIGCPACYQSRAPSPKGREEREESSSADRYLLHAEWVAKTMLRHYPSAEDGREDTLERESAHVIRRLLARLRTHSPEEREDEAQPPVDALVDFEMIVGEAIRQHCDLPDPSVGFKGDIPEALAEIVPAYFALQDAWDDHHEHSPEELPLVEGVNDG